MKEPSSHHFYAAANKLLATSDIIPTANFIALLTKPPENNQEDENLRILRINFFHFCTTTFPVCLSLKLMRIYTSKVPRVSKEIRENAIKFLYFLISEEEVTSSNLTIVQELSPVISCLEEQVISDFSFKILSQVVNRIAYDIFIHQESTWHELKHYISSRAETEFAKSVFVFQTLSMPLDAKEFVVPLMENLVPAILKRLKGEEREWGLAFTGGFCAAIHLLETTRVDMVESLVDEMLNSVKRRTELGFLEKALEDVEEIVLRQLGWYCTNEFRFVSGLVLRIDKRTEEKSTKIVLQRIKMIVEKRTLKSVEEIDNGNEDWLNRSEEFLDA